MPGDRLVQRCLETADGPALGERAVRESRVRPSRVKAMAGRQKVIVDEVHQNQILRELYLKELRTQKLYTQYHVNPLRKGEGRHWVKEGKRVAPGPKEPAGVLGRGRRGWGRAQ